MTVSKIEVSTSGSVGVIRVGVQGPPGIDVGAAYDDSALTNRIEAVELAVESIPAGLSIEQVHDLVAAMLVSGSGVTVDYNDTAGTLTITATGGGSGGGFTAEEIEDLIGGMIAAGSGVSVSYDDLSGAVSIALSGESFTTTLKTKLDGIAAGATVNASDAALRDRATHTGTQDITTISGLQAALDGKSPAAHSHPWSDLTGVPTEFVPSAHQHAIGDVSGLQAALDGKAPTNHSHAISDVTGLQTALTTATDTLVTLQAEIAEARAQLSAVSAFAATNAGGIVPGRYYDNATTSVTNSNYTSAVNRVDMTPFITSRTLQVDQIGFAVATAGSAAYGRAFVYGCGADGWPSDLIFEGTDDLDLNSANFRGHTLASPITFEANRVYWVGWRFGVATTYAVLRGLNISSSPNLGLSAATNNTYCTVLRRTIPFATRLPATWGFVESDLTANIVPPSIRMRAT